MKTKLMLITVVFTMLVAANTTVNLSRSESSDLTNSLGMELIVNSDEMIYGLQFNLQYNTDELAFNGAASLLEDFTFDFREKDNGVIKGLIFSMTGESINPDALAEVIQFDFEPAAGFQGESFVQFTDLILAGSSGTKIPADLPSFSITTNPTIPVKTALLASYPNPFNPVTNISYVLSVDGDLSITVYDLQGRQVTELMNGFQSAGHYSIKWNATDFASGIYMLRMTTNEYQSAQRIILLK